MILATTPASIKIKSLQDIIKPVFWKERGKNKDSNLREYFTYSWLSYQDAAKQFFLQAMEKLFCNCSQDCDVGRMNE
jgi:hypothetical protein